MPAPLTTLAPCEQSAAVPDYNMAASYIAALTGLPVDQAVVDFRCLSDTDASAPACPMRGTLSEHWERIVALQAEGYGAFVAIQELDGHGLKRENVATIRCHAVDLDGIDAVQQYEAASRWNPAPSFAVSTSPGRFHVYWCVAPYAALASAESIQRRLRVQFNGDRAVIDPTRVLRLAGSLHLKDPTNPYLTTCHALAGISGRIDAGQLDFALAGVLDLASGTGDRHALGDPALAAPSLEWLFYALTLVDPNELSRDRWIAHLSAAKQAGWSHDEEATLAIIMQWCQRYDHDDPAENVKQLASLRATSTGWPWLVRNIPQLQAAVSFGSQPQIAPAGAGGTAQLVDCSGEFLTGEEQKHYFRGCTLIAPDNKIIGPRGIIYTPAAFNNEYGGKRFIIDSQGKTTDDAWKAATRSTLSRVSKVDYDFFRTDHAFGAIITDELGRSAVNSYLPALIKTEEGDISPFLRHLEAMLPDAGDRHILLSYLAHNVQRPGVKIPWAPVIQSVKGAGKNLFKYSMKHSIGRQYVHDAKSSELPKNGGKFNGWMLRKLLILADEIKTDDQRNMLEILKTFISEEEIESESKGFDQKMADNTANWLCFTNHKDAIPIDRDERRYAIFYSALQSADDLQAHGFDDAYFKRLYVDYLDYRSNGAGLRHVAHYLMTYPLPDPFPMRAPCTSTTKEAIAESWTAEQQHVMQAVEQERAGFRGDWISTRAVTKVLEDARLRDLLPAAKAKMLRDLGYSKIGAAPREYLQEGPGCVPILYNVNPHADVENYGRVQGYE